MKKAEIRVGGEYIAKVSNQLTNVRVDAIRDFDGFKGQNRRVRAETVYDVTNLKTGRKITFRSAAKFRREVTARDKIHAKATYRPEPVKEAEQCPDPTSPRSARRTGQEILMNKENLSALTNSTDQPTNGLSSLLKRSTEVVQMGPPHLIIIARAGTGKTTTLVEGLKVVRGLAPRITPSPQQEAIWESLKLSRLAKTICFVAFNRSIADELKVRVPEGCEASTMHGAGFRSVLKAFPFMRGRELNKFRSRAITEGIIGRSDDKGLLQAVEQLVALCKQNLTKPTETYRNDEGFCVGGSSWEQELDALARHYEVEMTDRGRVFDLVPKVLELSKDPKQGGMIDYDDMIWLPVVLNLPLFQFDLLLVDEAQDLNRCQQALAKRMGRRLILCGDPRQAIYGFAGADADSIPRMERELGTTPRGVQVLPLTVTRRCGRAIVEEAKRIVPDFDWHQSNGPGKISNMTYDCKPVNDAGAFKFYQDHCQDGDMVLCRVNAPLISQCFRFLKAGRKANIQGRDIGKGIISLIDKTKAQDVPELIAKIDDWLHKEMTKENARRNPSEARLIALQDRADCILCFCEGAESVREVTAKISRIFTDDKQSPGIKLSSIHKAKGLEARRVFLLRPKGGECPHPTARSTWQREQEMNLLYIAITRAIEELVYVS